MGLPPNPSRVATIPPPPLAMTPPSPPGIGATIGRERESQTLRALLDSARGGTGRLVAITGEAGSGKTHLAQHVADEALALGDRAGWGRVAEGEWCPPYGPWADALTQLAGDLTPAERAAVAEALGPAAPTLGRLVPHLVEGEPGPAGSPAAGLTLDEERRWHIDALTRAIAAIAHGGAGRATVLVLDDCHWADPGSLALLRSIPRALRALPVLVVATLRGAAEGATDAAHARLLSALRRDPAVVTVDARPFDHGQIAAFVARTVGREPEPALVDALRDATEGNPFYLGEMVAQLQAEARIVARGALAGLDGQPGTTLTDAVGVPERVRQVIGLRVARYEPEDRRLLDVLSLFPGGAPLAPLARIVEEDETAVLDRIELLSAGQIVTTDDRDGGRIRFVHSLVRDTIASGLLPARRALLHRRIAEVSRAAAGGQPGVSDAEIAFHHHRAAGWPGSADGVPYALAAAAAARASGGRDSAVALLRMGRDLARTSPPEVRFRVGVRLAEAEADALKLADAEASARATLTDLEEALATGSVDAGEGAAGLATIAAAMKGGGAHRVAWWPLVARGIALAGPAGDRLTWARLHLLDDPIAAVAPDPSWPAGAPWLRAGTWRGFDPEAVAIARRDGTDDDAAQSFESYDARTAPETWALVRLARAWRAPPATMRGLTVAANDLMYRHGDFAAAESVWRELLAVCERHGAISWQAQAYQQLSLLAVARGDFAGAEAQSASAGALLRRLGPYREHDVHTLEMRTCRALYLGDDWRGLGAEWERSVLAPTSIGRDGHAGAADLDARTGLDLSSLAGAVYGSLAAAATCRAGDPERAAAIVDAVVAIVAAEDPAGTNQNQNGAVALAVDTLWERAIAHLVAPVAAASRATAPPDAADRRRLDDLAGLTERLLAAGIGDYPQTSLALSRLRIAAMRDPAGAPAEAFAAARERLASAGQHPLAGIAHHDEGVVALALAARGEGHRDETLARAGAALDAADGTFERLGMPTWRERVAGLRDRAARIAAGPVRTTLKSPDGYEVHLTDRELGVVRLIARGRTDREIADALFISPRTVHTHVRNALTKTGLTNRTELSVWAVEQGLLRAERANTAT